MMVQQSMKQLSPFFGNFSEIEIFRIAILSCSACVEPHPHPVLPPTLFSSVSIFALFFIHPPSSLSDKISFKRLSLSYLFIFSIPSFLFPFFAF